jgi:two-component system, LytTR family, sensor kinase
MRPTLSRWGLGFLAWTVLALLSASQLAVALGAEGRPVVWPELLSNRLVDWYSCAIFTPVFFWLARRYPIDRRQWPRHLPLHVLAAAVITPIKFALEGWILVDLMGWQFPPLGRLMAHSFITENIAFWCVIAAVHAIEFHQRVREREVLTARLQARLSEAQLDALTSRLHPHFLFNTLQGISTLVYRDPAAADAMLGHLSTLLRRALTRGPGHEVSLAEELALLEEYLAIVQVRLGDRVAIAREVDDTALSGLVPQLLMQPLVENAIEHGVARRAGAGRIGIKVAREGSLLRVSVTDDGPGLERSAPEGVGLGSTRLRLGELYGEQAKLSLDPGAGGGLVVTVTLPFHEKPVLPARVEPAA